MFNALATSVYMTLITRKRIKPQSIILENNKTPNHRKNWINQIRKNKKMTTSGISAS